MSNSSTFLANLVKQSAGKIVTVTFIKKDGSTRVLNGRLGVKSYLKTDGGRANRSIVDLATNKEYLTIFDMQKRGYRSIHPDRILSVSMNGVKMYVPHSQPKSQAKVDVTSTEPVKTGQVKWSGGQCPVSPETKVRYRMANDPHTNVTRVGNLLWQHSQYLIDAEAHITEYEVVQK